MEKEKFDFQKFIKENKRIVGFYLIWLLFHFIFLLASWNSQNNTEQFWPFYEWDRDHGVYDLSEFLVYSLLPVFIYLIYYFLKDDVRKNIEND